MNITSEALGTLRADLRRVEVTLGARLDARMTASEALLRDEIRNELRLLREEVTRLRAEVTQHFDHIIADVSPR